MKKGSEENTRRNCGGCDGDGAYDRMLFGEGGRNRPGRLPAPRDRQLIPGSKQELRGADHHQVLGRKLAGSRMARGGGDLEPGTPDIKIEAEFQADLANDKYMLALTNGTAPDVMACALDWVTTFGSANLLEPLDEVCGKGFL